MKLRSMICGFALAAAVTASAVTSSNTCGLMNVPSTDKITMIAVPWVTVLGEGDTMKVANLVKTDTLTAGDELYYYDGATYYRWTLTDGVWTPSATTKSEGGQSVTVQAPDADYGIARGKGLFLVRKDTTKEIWLYGQYSSAAVSVTPAAGRADAPAYTMIANPNAAAYDLNAKGVAGAAGDQILLGDGVTLYTRGASQWTKTVVVEKTIGTKKIQVKSQSAEGVTIPAGQGAWYVSKGGSPTIAW